MHVTLRARREVGVLRTQVVVERIARVLRDSGRDRKGVPSGFRVLHYSVQEDHVHLIVEARDAELLASRMAGVVTWIARRVNGILGRKGRFWGDRYHRRDLCSPREVRNALVYVLANRRKHVLERTGDDPGGIDPFSSAVFLEGGWETRAGPALERAGRATIRIDGAPPVARPRTWLARHGWLRHGRLRVDEVPRARPRPRTRGACDLAAGTSKRSRRGRGHSGAPRDEA